MKTEEIAAVCHEVNRAYCASLGDLSQLPWADAPVWQRESAIEGVKHVAANPDATPGDSHRSWLAQKERDGWKYGAVKDEKLKEHPCFVPFDQLPRDQQAKDFLFLAVARSLLVPDALSVAVGEFLHGRENDLLYPDPAEDIEALGKVYSGL